MRTVAALLPIFIFLLLLGVLLVLRARGRLQFASETGARPHGDHSLRRLIADNHVSTADLASTATIPPDIKDQHVKQVALAVVWIVIAATLEHLLRLGSTIAACVAGVGYAFTHVALNRRRFADLTQAETRRALLRKRPEERGRKD